MRIIDLPIMIGLLLVAAGAEAQSTGNVRLVKGAKYNVENKITSSSSSEIMGQTMESNADVTTVYHIEVQDQQAQQYHLKNSISSIKMNMTSPAQSVSFDSEKPGDLEGPIGSAVKPYINQPQDVVMDMSGNLVDKTDTAQAADSSSQSENMLKQLGDPKAVGYGASMAFLSIPSQAAVGMQWQDSTSKDGVTRVTRYEIKDLKGQLATVAMTGTEDRNTQMEMQGMQINTKTKGQFSGTGVVELSTGVIQQNTYTESAEGTISVMGQDIPTKVKVTSSTSVSPL